MAAVLTPQQMYGRHTGNARHLTDPANKVYYFAMEEGFYEVDVKTLAVTELFRDEALKAGGRRPVSCRSASTLWASS